MGAAHGRSGSEPDRFEVYQGLARTLAGRSRGDHADGMARGLLAHESELRELVGVTADGDRALFYGSTNRTLLAVGVDAHGVGSVERTLARDLDDPAAWLDVYGDDLAWIHPRYRRDDGE